MKLSPNDSLFGDFYYICLMIREGDVYEFKLSHSQLSFGDLLIVSISNNLVNYEVATDMGVASKEIEPIEAVQKFIDSGNLKFKYNDFDEDLDD